MSKRRHSAAELPDDTLPRVRVLMERSAPDPERPRLSEDLEKRLEPVERSSAACYADIENRTAALNRITRDLKKITKK